jgi:glycosyltransferase involved in cell wall biosynthesis
MPEISVIIPYFNHGVYIEENLESLKTQIFQDFEVIIVDDCSSNIASQQKLQTVSQKYAWVRIFKSPQNLGPAFCRNFGIKQAKGN